MVVSVADPEEKERISTLILNRLPEWFGLPDSTQSYIQNSKSMPFWAFVEAGGPQGFIALKETGASTAEIYVMGVLKERHRSGIGTALWHSFLSYAREKGYEYVQVKTVQSGRYEEYDRTNRFYQRLGFRELEVFPSLWDAWNPCQIYIKYIG